MVEDAGIDDGLEKGVDALYGLCVALVRQSAREIGLTAASTLSTLERSGPRRVTDLAVLEGITQPSMTALVQTLERARFVVRGHDPKDRRVVLVSLTAAGARYLATHRDEAAGTVRRLVAKLAPPEISTLVGAAPVLCRLAALAGEERIAASVRRRGAPQALRRRPDAAPAAGRR